jgi:hypothetical protein
MLIIDGWHRITNAIFFDLGLISVIEIGASELSRAVMVG